MPPEYYKIKDHEDLIKSAASKAVLNVDGRSLNKYREERDRISKVNNIVDETNRLNKEVTEIKQQLNEILSLLRNKA